MDGFVDTPEGLFVLADEMGGCGFEDIANALRRFAAVLPVVEAARKLVNAHNKVAELQDEPPPSHDREGRKIWDHMVMLAEEDRSEAMDALDAALANLPTEEAR